MISQEIDRAPGSTDHPRGPLLTICVPSYNRGERVRALVDYLLPVISEYSGEIEMIVSNNVSEDGTEVILGRVHNEHFTLHNREVHLPTAEEHIFASATLCRGEYVWFLGDDDIPNITVMRDMIELLRQGRYDFMFYNSHLADGHAGHLGSSVLRMNGSVIEAPFDDAAPELGLISSFAGLSNVICRRSRLDHDAWPDIVKISYVYSHVVWWYLSFAHSSAAIINQPLVTYRQDESAGLFQDFSRIARRIEVSDYFFWAEGMIRLLQFMEDRGAITMEQVRRVWETRRDGTQFRLIDNLVHVLFEQVRLSSRSSESRNKMSDAVLEMCTNWVLRADPAFFDLARLIRLAHAAGELELEDRTDRLTWTDQDFRVLLQHKLDNSGKYIGVVRMYKGFDIYKHFLGRVAFSQSLAVDRRNVLGCLDPVDGPGTLTAKDDAEINRRIDEYIDAERAMAA